MVEKGNDLLRGQASHGRFRMTIETTEWRRVLEVEVWNQGTKKGLVVVHRPLKDKGNSTLSLGYEIWSWIPRVERVIKVPPTMMHSWNSNYLA